MSDYFNCKLCDKSIKINSKKNHLNSAYHKFLSDSILIKDIIQNPDFSNKENILKNYIPENNKTFESDKIICRWILRFPDTIIIV